MHVMSFGVSLLLVAMTSSEATAGDVRAAGVGPSASAPVGASSGATLAPGIEFRGVDLVGDASAGPHSGPHSGADAASRTIQFRTGLILFGDPPGPMSSRGGLGSFKLKAHGKVSAVTWVGPHGESLSTRFPSSVDLSAISNLVAPAGDWTDVRLSFASDLEIEGAVNGLPLDLALAMGSWTIPLEEPVRSAGQTRVGLNLDLPEALVEELDASGGLDVAPGDALHDELRALIQDAAMAAAR